MATHIVAGTPARSNPATKAPRLVTLLPSLRSRDICAAAADGEPLIGRLKTEATLCVSGKHLLQRFRQAYAGRRALDEELATIEEYREYLLTRFAQSEAAIERLRAVADELYRCGQAA